jgi:hypothetical protein|tara:strand:+ start:1365 stop:1859 length:495 start_codon:yes stop_codon:yes gene_type:complete
MSNKNVLPRNDGSKTNNQSVTQGLGNQSRDPNAENRPPRVAMQGSLNLDYPESRLDRENFAYRWFLDDPIKPGRIESAKRAYWDHCEDDGVKVTRPAGNATHYLMRLPMNYWLEDQQLKREKNLATMSEEAQLGANEYAPTASGRREGGESSRVSQSSSDNPYG